MASHPEHRQHPIRILHLLGCLAIALWFARFAWVHHPARGAFRSPSVNHRRWGPTQALPEGLRARLALVGAVMPDAIGGLGVLALFALGTGIYARRFEVWLEVHRAGEAAALRGLGLDRAALGANKDRKRGATV